MGFIFNWIIPVAQYSFDSYSNNLIKLEVTEEVLLICTYKQQLSTFLYLSVDALSISLVALIATLLVVIDNMLDNDIKYFFLDIIYKLDSITMWVVGLLIYISIIFFILIILFKKTKSKVNRYRNRYIESKTAFNARYNQKERM